MGETDGGTGTTGRDSTGEDASTTADDSDGPNDSATDGGGVRFDIPVPPDPGDPSETGCEAVDLLFVIDPSPSMFDNQQNLIDNFPVLVQGMRQQLADVDSYHVGVVHSGYAWDDPDATTCEALGDLITRPIYEPECGPFVDGMRYMTDQDDLETDFTCVASLGQSGTQGEQMMSAATWAVDPANGAPGACNEGFVRGDALLVVVLVTDEDDGNDPYLDGSPGDPDSWFQHFVSVKQIETNVVVVSLVWEAEADATCSRNGGERLGTRLMDFTNRFTYGYIGNVCAPDYGPLFTGALGSISQACDGFQPPG